MQALPFSACSEVVRKTLRTRLALRETWCEHLFVERSENVVVLYLDGRCTVALVLYFRDQNTVIGLYVFT